MILAQFTIDEDNNNQSMYSTTDIKIEKANDSSAKTRKAMLRKVVSGLYRFTKNNQNFKNISKNQIIQEMRMRVYKILKNLVWEKFEHRMCESDTSVKLHRLLDICKDHLKEPIHCFDAYSKFFTATFTEKMLLKMSKIPLLAVSYTHLTLPTICSV